MPQIASLYSGSSGNSTLIKDGDCCLLVDLGGSCRKTVGAVNALGVAASSVSAVLVTHEHSDHISGLEIFLKYYNVPVFGNEKTLAYIENNLALPASAQLVPIDGCGLVFGGVEVTPFDTPHDSVHCLGYRFDFDCGCSAAVATDLGHMTDSVYDRLRGCSTVALESNYDDGMLRLGRYPAFLKQRILSDYGHLSNFDCALTAAKLAECGTKHMLLMHLSKDNNTPNVALTTCISELEAGGSEESCTVAAAPRYESTGFLEI